MTTPKTDSVAVLREMLPCPFCGEVPTIANIRADENQGTKWGGVVCSCGIVGPEVRTGYGPVAEWADSAAEEWNKRAPGGVGDAAPAVHSFDPTATRRTVTLRWPDGRFLAYDLALDRYTDTPEVMRANQQEGGVGDAVTEEMVEAALDAQPFAHTNSSTRVWQLIASDGEGSATVMRVALTAAFAARTGKGETP